MEIRLVPTANKEKQEKIHYFCIIIIKIKKKREKINSELNERSVIIMLLQLACKVSHQLILKKKIVKEEKRKKIINSEFVSCSTFHSGGHIAADQDLIKTYTKM